MNSINSLKILVTGSSGFIGSRLTKRLIVNGNLVWGLDRLPSVIKSGKGKYHHTQLDLTSKSAQDKISKLLIKHQIQLVIHLASLIKVGEGEKQPDLYKSVNIGGTNTVLKGMKNAGIKKIIFASSAAVYQSPNLIFKSDEKLNNKHSLRETDPLIPVSIYGQTKLKAEKLIQQYVKSDQFEGVSFRFFNVGGGKEIHQPSVHLIPIIIDKLVQHQPIQVFGKDYHTSDGTCYRDYFHVTDLIEAILLAIQKWDQIMSEESKYHAYNLGQGNGYTVLQVCRQVIQNYTEKFPLSENKQIVFTARRPGDPPILLANCNKAKSELGWSAKLSLNRIITDTLKEMIDSEMKS